MFDVTDYLHKNTICHNGRDMAGIRWKYDQYFRRDGRHVGSCNWFTVASDWCLDLWRPLDDLTLEEALANINITIGERCAAHGLGRARHTTTVAGACAAHPFCEGNGREFIRELGLKAGHRLDWRATTPQKMIAASRLSQGLPDGQLLSVAVALAADPWYLAKVDLAGTVTPLAQFPSNERLPWERDLRKRW